jgi:hypothetical protein
MGAGMGKGIMGNWEATSMELIELYHFYDKSGSREFVKIIEAFDESAENITLIALVHAGFCREVASAILKEFTSRKLNSNRNDLRYWAASKLYDDYLFTLENFKVFN